MKYLALFLLISFSSYSQVASRLLSTQATPINTNYSGNILFVDTTAIGMLRIYPRTVSSLLIKPYHMKWLNDTINIHLTPYMKSVIAMDSIHNLRVGLNSKLKSSDTTGHWKSINYTPTWSDVTSKPSFSTVATSGSYNDLTSKPTIPNAQVNSDWNSVSGVSQILNKPNLGLYYLASNPNGYISTVSFSAITLKPTTISGYGIIDAYPLSGNPSNFLTSVNSGQITSALGYTPYNSTNPNNYISSINSGNVTTALGFTPYNSTNPSGYISSFTETDPLFNNKFALKSTADLAENTNLYYTATRFNAAFSTKTTSDLIEGVKLYYTDVRSRSAISGSIGISYNNTTGVITNSSPDQTVVLNNGVGINVTGTYPNFTIANSIVSPTDNIVTRTINSSTYTISTTKTATVRYNIKITCTATIGSASSGKVLFQYSTNAGSTWVDAGEVENSNTVTLAVVLNSSTTQSGFITWNVPANALCRLVPTSTGTTTITWIRGQETY